MRHRFEWAGWLLFLFSSFGFIIDTWMSRSWWGLAASLLFLGGVIAFLIPLTRSAIAASRTTALTEELLMELAEQEPAPQPQLGAGLALASIGDGQPGFEPADDAAVHVGDVLEPEL